MTGLVEVNSSVKEDNLDLVLQTAATAFGFVYVHPFQDGNGKLHRSLIHHVLDDRRFPPAKMVF
jgi:Fic family protein